MVKTLWLFNLDWCLPLAVMAPNCVSVLSPCLLYILARIVITMRYDYI